MKTHTFTAFFCLFILLAGIVAAENLSVKWSYGLNNTANAVVLAVNVADYDGDGFNDVAVGAKEDTLQGSAGWVYILNNDGTVKWAYELPGAISVMISADLSGEGKPQIIAGVSSRIYIFDGEGNSKHISLGDLSYKATNMIVDDINKDGLKELVISGGSLEKGKVFIFDKYGNLSYSADTLLSPSAMYVEDINGDGQKEIIVGTIDRDDSYPGYVQTFTSKAVELWMYKTQKGVQSIYALDIDGDGSQEILAGSIDSLYILSSEGAEKGIKSNITRPGYVFNRILATDLDGDGSEEVVFGCTNNVYIYDKSLTNLHWKNTVGTSVFDLVSEDIDGDGFKELLVASDILYLFNKDGMQVYSFNANTSRFSVRDIYVGDIKYDTYPDIVIGATDGKVYVLGSSTHLVNAKVDLEHISLTLSTDVNKTGGHYLLIDPGEKFYVFLSVLPNSDLDNAEGVLKVYVDDLLMYSETVTMDLVEGEYYTLCISSEDFDEGDLWDGNRMAYDCGNHTVMVTLGSKNITSMKTDTATLEIKANNTKIINSTSEITVCSAGCNYTKIQEAVNSAIRGDNITVKDGYYYEFITINKSLNIRSENGPSETYIGADGYNGHIFEINADYVNVSGFYIDGINTGRDNTGVYLKNSKYCNFSNNNITSNYNGISLENSSVNTFLKNNILFNTYGLEIVGSSNNLIQESMVNRNNYGIHFDSSNNNTLESSSVSHSNSNAIEFENSSYNKFIKNNIINNRDGIALNYHPEGISQGNLIGYNNISSNSNYGIMSSLGDLIIGNNIRFNLGFRSGANCIVRDNIIESNGYDGTEFGSNVTLINNSFINDGLSCDDYSEHILVNNTVNGRPLVYLANASNLEIDSAGQIVLINCRNITMNNLVLTQAPFGIKLINTNDCVISNNDISSNMGGCLRNSGVSLSNSMNNWIINNSINANGWGGVSLSSSNNNIITGNNMSLNEVSGISLSASSNNNIENNNISNNLILGVGLYSSSYNSIQKNRIELNGGLGVDDYYRNDWFDYDGVYVSYSFGNNIISNIISFNVDSGICLDSSALNTIYNNFFNNTNNAYINNSGSNWNTSKKTGNNVLNGNSIGGNYWSDYTANDSDDDGIGDNPYYLDSTNIDYLPLVLFSSSCSLEGDYAPCNEVSLSEVISFINKWVLGDAHLSDVVRLITAWSAGAT